MKYISIIALLLIAGLNASYAQTNFHNHLFFHSIPDIQSGKTIVENPVTGDYVFLIHEEQVGDDVFRLGQLDQSGSLIRITNFQMPSVGSEIIYYYPNNIIMNWDDNYLITGDAIVYPLGVGGPSYRTIFTAGFDWNLNYIQGGLHESYPVDPNNYIGDIHTISMTKGYDMDGNAVILVLGKANYINADYPELLFILKMDQNLNPMDFEMINLVDQVPDYLSSTLSSIDYMDDGSGSASYIISGEMVLDPPGSFPVSYPFLIDYQSNSPSTGSYFIKLFSTGAVDSRISNVQYSAVHNQVYFSFLKTNPNLATPPPCTSTITHTNSMVLVSADPYSFNPNLVSEYLTGCGSSFVERPRLSLNPTETAVHAGASIQYDYSWLGIPVNNGAYMFKINPTNFNAVTSSNYGFQEGVDLLAKTVIPGKFAGEGMIMHFSTQDNNPNYPIFSRVVRTDSQQVSTCYTNENLNAQPLALNDFSLLISAENYWVETRFIDLEYYETGYDTYDCSPRPAPLSIHELHADFEFTVTPNPVTNGVFQIKTDAPESQMQILNLQGQLIYQAPLKTGVNSINTGNLAGGLYLIKVTHSNQQLFQTKILIH